MFNRSVATAVFTGFLGVLGVTQAFAQYGPTLRADIPFEFAAGTAKLPAGAYTIQPTASTAQPLLSLREEEGAAAAFLMTNPAVSLTRAEQSKLVFHKYGDQYFLAQIWVEGLTSGWQVPASRSERELSRRAARNDVVTILARR